MESDGLLENLSTLDRVTTNETEETIVPLGTPYGQLAVVSLVVCCGPVATFVPAPFIVKVKSPCSHPWK